jgi:hypothetical protein
MAGSFRTIRACLIGLAVAAVFSSMGSARLHAADVSISMPHHVAASVV